ncbi:MAG: hypothetical protein JNM03_14325 [Sphingopyxis sp.]|uniref:hypothetical protein n=1 Tax=Sphingopyxis sp. TaxID=1908224 RepID=UPI001A4CEF3B|nr:hypothetical protein [Sphingopyxis sp.]MBL9071154.1 hypothetical protein [Sphingopyxis sp.]
MIIDRRQALGLTAGIAAAAAIAGEAQACSQRPPPAFRATARERRRMAGQLDLFRHYWNEGRPDVFLAEQCIEHVEVNLLLGDRGGRWSDPVDAIRKLHAKHSRMTTGFSGLMFDPLLPILYATAEFSEAPRIPGEEEEIVLCQRAGMAPAFAIQMQFVESFDPRPPRLPADDRIVRGISLRPHGFLARWFQSNWDG